MEIYFSFCNSDPATIIKVGEGTFGEAFNAGTTVCKIVPFDGDLLVNGEVQKQIHSDCFEDFRLAISKLVAVQQKLRQNPAERRSAPRGSLVLWSREPPLKLLKVVTEASPMMWSITLKVVTEASLFG
ncbi:hypothetical protein IFM89_030026 [Coptis chinensis]|uniref:Uncharacterized protein n=1 Tax=Coptis chinensis TaxID=261450 RepID=A0A835IV49_9MAGN|nr:hypothetical protein IFM89_030026 [Coptis chinensis]